MGTKNLISKGQLKDGLDFQYPVNLPSETQPAEEDARSLLTALTCLLSQSAS